MFCSNCGIKLDDKARFCPVCGVATRNAAMGAEAVPTVPKQNAAPSQAQDNLIHGQHVTENIYLCPDGMYRWIYEFKMMRNPTILFMIWKIFGCIIAGILIVESLLMLIEGDLNGETLLSMLKMFGIVTAVMLVISFIAYLIVAAMNGWEYIVLFEMNDEGVTHTQMQQQFKKAQALGWLTAMAGLATGNLSMAGLGINTAVNNSVSSEFSKVKNIKVYRHRGVIKVNELLFKNQVYAAPEDFDFVLNYITARLPADAGRK